jgi:hypothetical protein
MASNSKMRLALGVLGVMFLLPAGAFAGPPSAPPAEPGPFCAASSYSPCHYWTPLLYRCYAKCYYGVCGHRYTLDYYPPRLSGEPITSHGGTSVDPGTPSGEAKLPPARSPEAGDR